MLAIPQIRELIPILADVLAVRDLASEQALSVQSVLDGCAQAVRYIESAVELDIWQVSAQPVQLQSTPAPREKDDCVSQLSQHQIDLTFIQPGAVRQIAHQFGFLDRLTGLDLGAINPDSSDFLDHIGSSISIARK